MIIELIIETFLNQLKIYTNIYLNDIELKYFYNWELSTKYLYNYLLGGRDLVETTEKSKRTSKSEKGFLKQKGYSPRQIDDKKPDKSTKSIEPSSHEMLPSDEIAKPPRPEHEQVKKGKKDDKRKKRRQQLERSGQPEQVGPGTTEDRYMRMIRDFRISIMVIGIVILLIGIAISYQDYILKSEEPSTLEESGYNLMKKLRNHDSILTNLDYGTVAWDSDEYLKLTSEDFQNDIGTDFKDVEYLIEVIDLSSYPIKYNRTVQNGLALSSNSNLIDINSIPDDKFTISTFINIHVSNEEVHLAEVSVSVWEK